MSKRIVILISGRGSNMEAILNAHIDNVEIAAVISNRPDAKGLPIAAAAGVPTAVLDHKNYSSREAFDQALIALIDTYQPDLVVLAGFMRILTAEFTGHYHNRLINIHPSLLPAFTGLHTHERAIAEGVRFHGCTIHFVTPALDHGPIILQAVVPVLPDDDADQLAARVLKEEHRLYPEAIRLFAADRLVIDAGRVRILSA